MAQKPRYDILGAEGLPVFGPDGPPAGYKGEKSRLYTNKDLKTSGPTTTYGPWKTVSKPGQASKAGAGKKTESQLLDEMLAEQDAGTYLDPVAAAKSTLARLSRADHLDKAPQQIANLKATSAQPLETEKYLRSMGTESGVALDAIKQGLQLGAIPLSMTGGGLGLVAGGGLALQALGDVIENPGVGTGVAAGLSAMPYGLGKAARWFTGGARGAKAAAKPSATILQGADAFEDVLPRVRTPKSAAAFDSPGEALPNLGGSSVLKGADQFDVAGNAGLDDFKAAIESVRPPAVAEEASKIPASLRGWDEASMAAAERRLTPRAAKTEPSIELVDDVGGLNGSGESSASLEALSRQTGMQGRGEQFVVYDRAGNARPLIGPDAVDYVPRVGETYGIEGPNGFQVLADMGGKAGKRPPKYAIHPSQEDGVEFGIEEIPELSEGELERIQALFSRNGVR
jgi:hypothetical protein